MNRRGRLALLAYQRRQAMKRAIRGEMFDRQLGLHDDPLQFRAAHPGRRGGKSGYIPRSCCLDVLDAGEGEAVFLGAETQKKAFALHWLNIATLKSKHKLPLEPNRQDAAWLTPWGARIQFVGISDANAVDLLRGFKPRAAKFDEVATYAALLKYLVQDVVKPALADTGGTLTLCGTPSLTRAGAWFEICHQKLGNFATHHWDLRDNPKFPRDPHMVLAEALKDLGGDPENATYQREWLGNWVNDPESQVYAYLADRNDIQKVPAHYDRQRWVHVLVVDFGVRDDCGWSILACHPDERRAYVLKSFKFVGLTTDKAAFITAAMCAEYDPYKVIGDLGGLGAAYGLEWNTRYAGRTASEIEKRNELMGEDWLFGLPEQIRAFLLEGLKRGPGATNPMSEMVCADKDEKRASIDFCNTELRAGRVKFVQPDCGPLTSELASLPWADDKRLKEHPGHANHCADTFLYGLKELRPYLNEAPESRLDPSVNTAEYDRWQEQREIEEADRDGWGVY